MSSTLLDSVRTIYGPAQYLKPEDRTEIRHPIPDSKGNDADGASLVREGQFAGATPVDVENSVVMIAA
jgi:hypothetical protein